MTVAMCDRRSFAGLRLSHNAEYIVVCGRTLVHYVHCLYQNWLINWVSRASFTWCRLLRGCSNSRLRSWRELWRLWRDEFGADAWRDVSRDWLCDRALILTLLIGFSNMYKVKPVATPLGAAPIVLRWVSWWEIVDYTGSALWLAIASQCTSDCAVDGDDFRSGWVFNKKLRSCGPY